MMRNYMTYYNILLFSKKGNRPYARRNKVDFIFVYQVSKFGMSVSWETTD